MNAPIIRNKGPFLKRVTAVITAAVFLLTQCGLGMAMPIYRQKAENLRAKAVGETDVSGNQGEVASAIGREIFSQTAGSAGAPTEAMGAGKQTAEISDGEFTNQRNFIWNFLKTHNIKKEKLIVFDEKKRLELDLSGCNLSDIRFLEGITSLKMLNLSYNQISDITPLEKLINLEWLLLYDNPKVSKKSLHDLTRHRQQVKIYNDHGMPISFASTVAGVYTEAMDAGKQTAQINDEEFEKQQDFVYALLLKQGVGKDSLIAFREEKRLGLDLYNCNLSDITFLEKLKNVTSLKTLHLSTNQISDIEPLKALTNLKELRLSNNQISDITPLGKLIDLEVLYLLSNNISDIEPLKDLTILKELHLSYNQISDMTSLGTLKDLKKLYLSYNKIFDITPLGNLTDLEDLNLSDNQIFDITPLGTLTNLEWLNLSDNSKLSKEKLCALVQHCSKVTIYSDHGEISSAGRIIFVISNQPKDIVEEVKTQAEKLISENDKLVPISVLTKEDIDKALKRVQETQGEYSVVMRIVDDITGVSKTIMDAAKIYNIQILNLPDNRNEWKESLTSL